MAIQITTPRLAISSALYAETEVPGWTCAAILALVAHDRSLMMIGLKAGLAVFAFLLSVGGATADDVTVGAIKISAPWARATPKSAPVGGGYLKITNTGATPDRLIGGSTPISGRLEVHEMSMNGGTMKMRELSNGLEIKPGETVELKPGGAHIMFMQLKKQLEQGQHFKATLAFEKAGKIDVDFSIAGIGAKDAGSIGHSNMPGMSHGGMNIK
jgi:periplasmic copper chaperone A